MVSAGAQHVAPHGSWPSPITAAEVAAAANTPGEIRADGDDIWWSESRASDGGRIQLVHLASDGDQRDVLPAGFSARTRVHEYGGGAWAVRDRTVVFANWDDQRLYRLDGAGGSAGARAVSEPVPLTPEPVAPQGLRYAEVSISPDGRWALCVRESHEPDVAAAHGEAVNKIVAVPLDGSAAADGDAVLVLVTGADFYAGPALSPDGDHVAWIEWDHPDMPWDATRLCVAPFDPSGDAVRSARVAGQAAESIVQPTWVVDGVVHSLWWSSDASGWWNLRKARGWRSHDRFVDDGVGLMIDGKKIEPPPGAQIGPGPHELGAPSTFAPVEAEIGGPHWVFGQRWFAPLRDGSVVASVTASGLDRLALLSPDGSRRDLGLPFTSISQVVAGTHDREVLVVAASPIGELAPWRVRIDPLTRSAVATLLNPPPLPTAERWDRRAWTSAPEPVEVPSANGRTVHALLYRPANPTSTGPAGEKPPLLVLSHGGPTSAARAMYKAATQFWTSRGFAVVDVNYGGSTGYGRPYRELLRDAWGIADREDCEAVARRLAERGVVDPARLAIRGGSAGGYTTLCALTFGDTFAAGASHYGIGDLAACTADTHKFESRYLDRLVGPLPEAEAIYRDRSPIHHTDQLSCPIILFQGLDDAVVPPSQAATMAAALAAKGVPHAYVAFEGEGHGFRRSENIIRTLEAELWFYGKVFGFDPADPIEAVEGAVGLS